jgi:hypothetical protein
VRPRQWPLFPLMVGELCFAAAMTLPEEAVGDSTTDVANLVPDQHPRPISFSVNLIIHTNF